MDVIKKWSLAWTLAPLPESIDKTDSRKYIDEYFILVRLFLRMIPWVS
jgi:hypothetical protein